MSELDINTPASGYSRRQFLGRALPASAFASAFAGTWLGGITKARADSHYVGNALRTPAQFGGGNLAVAPAALSVWPGFVTNNLYAINGGVPGPTIRVTRGGQFSANVVNQLAEPLVLHWHGLLTPGGQADGHPTDAVGPGQSYAVNFPIKQRAGTFWYHAHTDMLTGKQAYLGVAGLFIVDDPAEVALGLPTGDHDVPLLLADKRPNATKRLTYAPTMHDVMVGFLGTEVLANGTPQAYLSVDRGLYRFRLVNGSNARIFKIGLSNGASFQLIANDGGLLPAPITVTNFWLPPGARAEVLISFAALAIGTDVTLRTLAYTVSGGSPPGAPQQGTQLDILRFYVDRNATVAGTVPPSLLPFTGPPASASVRTRIFTLDEAPMGPGLPMEHWINGQAYSAARLDFSVNIGEVETWEIQNTTDEFHPFHIHGTQFQVLQRVGTATLPPEDTGRKDTVLVNPNETVRLLVRFDAGNGFFVQHCHNLEHEDSGMMQNFAVQPLTDFRIERQNGNIVVSWPGAVSTYDLYTAPSVDPGATWTKVMQTPMLTSGRWQVALPPHGSRAFFRLAAP